MNKLFRYSLFVALMMSVATLLMLSGCAKSKLDLQDFYENSYSPDLFELGNGDSMLVDSIPNSQTVEKVSKDLEAFFKKYQKEGHLYSEETLKSTAKEVAEIFAKFQPVFIKVGKQSDPHAFVVKVRYDSILARTADVSSVEIRDGQDTVFVDFAHNSFADPLLMGSNDYGEVLGSIFGDPSNKDLPVSNAFVPASSLRFIRLVKKAGSFFPNLADGAISDKPENQPVKEFLRQFGKENPHLLVRIRFYKW